MTIMLSDGTKLVANSRTTLSYPKTFQGAERREVSIKGETYLEGGSLMLSILLL